MNIFRLHLMLSTILCFNSFDMITAAEFLIPAKTGAQRLGDSYQSHADRIIRGPSAVEFMNEEYADRVLEEEELIFGHNFNFESILGQFGVTTRDLTMMRGYDERQLVDQVGWHTPSLASDTLTMSWLSQSFETRGIKPQIKSNAKREDFYQYFGDGYVAAVRHRAYVLASVKIHYRSAFAKQEMRDKVGLEFLTKAMTQQPSSTLEIDKNFYWFPSDEAYPENPLKAELLKRLQTVSDITKKTVNLTFSIEQNIGTSNAIHLPYWNLSEMESIDAFLSFFAHAKNMVKTVRSEERFPDFSYRVEPYILNPMLFQYFVDHDIDPGFDGSYFKNLKGLQLELENNYIANRTLSDQENTSFYNQDTEEKLENNMVQIQSLKKDIIDCFLYYCIESQDRVSALEERARSLIEETKTEGLKPYFTHRYIHGEGSTGEQIWANPCRHSKGIALRVRFLNHGGFHWKAFVWTDTRDMFHSSIDTSHLGYFSYKCVGDADRGLGGPDYHPGGRTYYAKFKGDGRKPLVGSYENPIHVTLGKSSYRSKHFIANAGGGKYTK